MLSAVELFSRVMKLLWPWNSSNIFFSEDSRHNKSERFLSLWNGDTTNKNQITQNRLSYPCGVVVAWERRKYFFNYIFVHCLISPHRHIIAIATHRKKITIRVEKKVTEKTFRDCRLMSRGRERPAIAWLIIINSKVDWEMAFEPENELNNC